MTEIELQKQWQAYTENIRKATPAQINEKPQAQRERIKYLEADRERWIKYYFHKYAFAEPAPFHLTSSDTLFAAYEKMKMQGYGGFYQCRAWGRGLSKSTRRMMEIFYLIFVKGFKAMMLLCSKSEKNAIKLLKPYRGHLEGNARLIQDYGKQVGAMWTESEFATHSGCSFLAVGRGQSPRGAKEEEMRVNICGFDDIDDKVLTRNADLLDEAWSWIEGDVIPCVEISRPFFIFFDNNIYAEDQLALRAQAYADDVTTVDLTDKADKTTWPSKNPPEIIALIKSKISYATLMSEYYNSPMTTGKTFPEIKWGPCPPLGEMPLIITYADPAPSNKDKPGQKSNLTNSRKAIFIVSRKNNDYYIYYGFLDVMSNMHFMEGMYDCREYIKNKSAAGVPQYYYIENNTLQDPFYEQVLLRLMYELGDKYGGALAITPDVRKKPEKWPRIEATLEPINRLGHLIFNIEEKENPHMQRLETQFKAAKPTSKQLDGPDAIEGAVYIINEKRAATVIGGVQYTARSRSEEKYY